MPALILLANANDAELRRLERILVGEHYLVSAVSSFKAADKLMKSVIPDLLVMDASLGGFNGIQFAALSRRDHPHLPVLVTHSAADPALAADASRRGFGFIGALDDAHRFVAAVRQTLGEYRAVGATIRKWRRKHLAAVDVRVAQPRAKLVDVSYGGCRLLLSDPHEADAPVFDVEFQRGITLRAQRVWSSRVPGTEAFWLGATFVESDPEQVNRWREFVDSID